MKKILLTLVLIASSNLVYADVNPFETTNESRQRHSAENYYQHREQNTPRFGSYNDKFGDVAPKGTDEPGFIKKYKVFGEKNG